MEYQLWYKMWSYTDKTAKENRNEPLKAKPLGSEIVKNRWIHSLIVKVIFPFKIINDYRSKHRLDWGSWEEEGIGREEGGEIVIGM